MSYESKGTNDLLSRNIAGCGVAKWRSQTSGALKRGRTTSDLDTAPPREAKVARLKPRNAGKSVVEKKRNNFLTSADAIGEGIRTEGRASEQNGKRRQTEETQLAHVRRQSVNREGRTYPGNR